MLDRQQMRQLKIEPPDQAVYKEVLGNWDALAKPLDGMGEFEELFARIGAIRRDPALDISNQRRGIAGGRAAVQSASRNQKFYQGTGDDGAGDTGGD